LTAICNELKQLVDGPYIGCGERHTAVLSPAPTWRQPDNDGCLRGASAPTSAAAAEGRIRGVWGVVPPRQMTRTLPRGERSSPNRVSEGRVRRRHRSASADGGTAWRASSTSGRGHRVAQRRRTPSRYKVADSQTSQEVPDRGKFFPRAGDATNVTPIGPADQF
jgi:hypothetical protein